MIEKSQYAAGKNWNFIPVIVKYSEPEYVLTFTVMNSHLENSLKGILNNANSCLFFVTIHIKLSHLSSIHNIVSDSEHLKDIVLFDKFS